MVHRRPLQRRAGPFKAVKNFANREHEQAESAQNAVPCLPCFFAFAISQFTAVELSV